VKSKKINNGFKGFSCLNGFKRNVEPKTTNNKPKTTNNPINSND
jgi:hypothetical protein